MDTITHGIAGALLGKAVCGGENLFSTRAMNKQRIVTWSLMIAAIFPDADTLRQIFSHNEMLVITWHRSITHSLLCLPLWALLLAAVTRWIARYFDWEAPSYIALTGIYALGILSHIFLDLITTFGTMIWSPLQWSRPAWDIIFIIDFTFTALLLLPQLLAWAYQDNERHKIRVFVIWLILAPMPLLIARMGQIVGAPIPARFVGGAIVLLSAAFLIPAVLGWRARVPYVTWNRAGLLAASCYLFAALYAHHAALDRVKKFAALENLDVQSIGALPLPPSLWRWDGLVNTPRGVYEMRLDLGDSTISALPNAGSSPLEYSFYPDALPNRWTAGARALPEVQKVLWFSRFPVTRFHKEGEATVVEISDLRFPKIRPDRPASFTYQVRFAADGTVLSQGWAKP
ncbi:MAG: hypothetical protein PVS2B2_01770 [Candidatus Acidiferrum sp.]